MCKNQVSEQEIWLLAVQVYCAPAIKVGVLSKAVCQSVLCI